MPQQSRAYTPDEAREQYLKHIRGLVTFWERAVPPEATLRERLEGVAFSLLTMIDGRAITLPALDLVVQPHPDDKQICIAEGQNWYEPGTILNADVQLHELFYDRKCGTEMG